MRPTTIVRRAMYAAGASKWGVFTNAYEKCHTVKMYGEDGAFNERVIASVLALGIPGLTISVRSSTRAYGFRPSIIARIPR